jgi:type IV fimbrial biogenesis protein FimT
MKHLSGQTLVELLVCLLIGSIMLSMALPSFRTLAQNNQKSQEVNQLVGMLHYARSTAVLKKRTSSLCAGTDRCFASLTWHNALLVFADQNGNGQLDAGEEILQQSVIADNYAWQWSNFRKSPHLTYEHDGTTRALNGTFTLCKSGEALHQVVISLSGRVRTQSPGNTAKCD